MNCTTWPAVNQAVFKDFSSAQTFINQKQAFKSIQISAGETAPDFYKTFYCKAQVVVTCEQLDVDDAVAAAVSSVVSRTQPPSAPDVPEWHPFHHHFYQKDQRGLFGHPSDSSDHFGY